ncbi:MAG TPA: hypothetical protein VFP65_10215 [Anaeromyxobacteraceae bacterium]|nr:hypothetical protein [Anaeromyxobacteraceae bacterium]
MARGEAAAERHRGAAAALVEAGVVTGLIAGGAMLFFLCVASGWLGPGFLAPVKAFAGVLLRRGALGGGSGATVLGLLVHGAVSVCIGVAFTAIAVRERTGPMASVGAGILFAIGAWVVMTFVAARFLDPPLWELARSMPFTWFAAHLVYGMAMGWARQLRDELR